jgi:hypothetical protein
MEAGLSGRFQAEAVDTAVHFKNRPNVGVKVMTDKDGRNSTKVHLSPYTVLEVVLSCTNLTIREESGIQRAEN